MNVFTIQHSIKTQHGECNARAKLFSYYNKKVRIDLELKLHSVQTSALYAGSTAQNSQGCQYYMNYYELKVHLPSTCHYKATKWGGGIGQCTPNFCIGR